MNNMKIDFKAELNAAQYEAVSSTEGPYLVIAGAGSGKTRVLVYRTAYLVSQGIFPENILLLTFTRRASREMLERASMILDDRCRKVSGGTFHSFANFILRKHGEVIGLSSSFTILDQTDAEAAVNSVRTHLGLNKADKRFPKKQMLLTMISKCVNKCLDMETLLYEEYPQFCEYAFDIQRVEQQYHDYKRKLMLLDYDDLLVFLRDLLASHSAVKDHLSHQYRYIMVDEYQDTNKVQAQIVQLLTAKHQNVMVVGDDAQSIYSFRGAYFRNIIDFPNIYPGTKVVKLQENYRSSQPILDLTNEVINCADESYGKALFTSKSSDSLPVYIDVPNENIQSKYIVRRVRQLQNKGVSLNDMAVLFRSGWHSNDLEVELAGEGIPFVKYGGQKFVEAAHIKDVLSYLRILANPANEISWLRVLTLMRGIGAKSAIRIIQQISQQKRGLAIEAKDLPSKGDLPRLIRMLQQADIEEQDVSEILKMILEFYYPVLIDHYDDYDKRINDLESLEKIAQRYSRLEEFLADMALEPPEKSIVEANARAPQKAKEHLVLSTIHSAKGLEWHTVFVIFLAEGYLPSYRSLDNAAALEEERRLFYVATTRAKEKLFLLRPQMDRMLRGGLEHGGFVYTRMSRFLEEGGILERFVEIERAFHNDHLSYREEF